MSNGYSTLIHDLPLNERPRERLEQYGPDALSIAELLAIILRAGYKGVSVIQLAQQLLSKFGSLRKLALASEHELSKVPGIGPAKACELRATFELGKRLAMSSNTLRPTVTSPQSAVNLVMEDLRYHQKESFRIILLDTRHQVLEIPEISVGSLNASIVHARETFKPAIIHSAAAIILVHNHPSGDPTPSKEDLELTTRLCHVGEILGIPVLDHLIIGDGRFISLKERSLM